MTWLRDRALQISGVLCLVGQGTLVYLGSAGQRVPQLAWPGLFLVLTLVLAVVLALSSRQEQVRRSRGGLFTAGVLVLAVGGLLAACLGLLGLAGPGEAAGAAGGGSQVLLTEARGALEGLPAAGAEVASRLEQQVADLPDGGDRGSLFRLLDPWPRSWPRHFAHGDVFPLELMLWSDGLPVAWTAGAEPFASLPVDSGPPDPLRFFQQSRNRWLIRTVFALPGPDGRPLVAELQVPLQGLERLGAKLQVVRLDQAPVLIDEHGDAVPGVALTDSQQRLAVVPSAASADAAVQREALKSRLMLLTGLCWLLALVGSGRLFLGWTGVLAALWLGRALLALVDYFRWAGPAFPHLEDPATPGHLISLVGPAYFATPFAGGWFASTADALATALVVGLTVWVLLRRLVLTEGDGLRWLGQGPASGLVFGLGAGTVLLGLRAFAALVTENANPRLIGQGVSLTFLSFWGLHLVLMLITFGLTALLTGWAAGRPWPRRRELGPWLAAAALAAVAAAGVFLAAGHGWRGLPFLGAVSVAALWLLAPVFRSRPRFLRRFAWPAVLLVAVVWNYAALREVYDRAERGWLERKGQTIAGAGEDWSRFLLEDALRGMSEQDAGSAPAADRDGIWRDKPAFDLWRSSALGDLGYSCLVEIIDAEGREESLFATGFMGDFQYEVLDRGPWTDSRGEPAGTVGDLIFQTERRGYPGGDEDILAAEIARRDGRGWIRVELPTRSWRISTLLTDLTGGLAPGGGYQPRSEVDRPVLLLRGDESGWLGTGDPQLAGPAAEALVQDLKTGRRQWAVIAQGDHRWLCRWHALPAALARTPGEGFLLGLRQSSPLENLLDLSRLMLLNLTLLLLLFLAAQSWYALNGAARNGGGAPGRRPRWLPGFQEKFLAGYLLLGMLLLLVVGASVDKVGYDRVRTEARAQTREGLTLAVAQLRSVLAEQARSLAGSEYIADLLVGQLAGQRPAGPLDLQQGMVFGADGDLLLDETLSSLTPAEAAGLLRTGRENSLLVIRDDAEIFLATVIPIDLTDVLAAAAADSQGADPGHGAAGSWGYFLYRQRLDQGLLRGLADLVQGQATLRLDGQPVLASHPGPVFSGQAALLAEPGMMASLLDHPDGPAVAAREGRPFAFTGGQPLPSFARDAEGGLVQRLLPGVLALTFPDREREYAGQRRDTVLFLAGLANLILLTALLLALLMSWSLFRPLRVLLTATRRLARGDFEAPLPDPGSDEVGRLAAAFGLMRSELLSARDRLAARERFLATVLDQVTVGVAVLDNQGRVVTLNPAGRHILADFLPELSDEDGAHLLLDEFRELGGGNPRWGGELRSGDGRHTLRGAMAPLELPDGRTDVMIVFEDITEFLQTKKMAINAELARQVAHEVKNPLTPIQLSVQLLAQAWRDQHPQLDRIVGDTVSRVLEQVELLRAIASEFSLLGRPGELDLVPVDLPLATAQVVDAYRAAWSAGNGGLSVQIDQGRVPPVLADPDSLQKILGNLMQNSLDAARDGQPLVVGIGWETSPRTVTLVWTDNGQGLDPDVADRLFDPYFSTKSKGTGLGLAICRNLADRMGGTMTLANRPEGFGARATLTLPRA